MYKPKNKVTCKYCGDTIYSLTSGRFTKCTCKNAFIDETEFYTRIVEMTLLLNALPKKILEILFGQPLRVRRLRFVIYQILILKIL